MTVVANYMGQKNGTYRVNVKNANPKGMLGDGGVIRYFDTEKAAREYIKQVNATGEDSFSKNISSQNNAPVRHQGDTFVPSSK